MERERPRRGEAQLRAKRGELDPRREEPELARPYPGRALTERALARRLVRTSRIKPAALPVSIAR
jgi:hypothetical protein